MRRRLPAVLVLLLIVATPGCVCRPASGTDRGGAVATVHPLATRAGLDALACGGNAVDAAVAAALTLGVVDCHNSGIGGGCFLLVQRENGEVLAIDGREQAPAAAHRDMYLVDGEVDPDASVEGALAVGIPGSLMAFDYALRVAGRLPLAHHLERAARIADGFRVGRVLAEQLEKKREALARSEGARSIFLKRDGSPWKECETLRQPDLAALYRTIARAGIGWFYGGPFATKVDAWMRANGGIVTADDFRTYALAHREPVRSTYRGREIIGFPPPSSGGVHVAQILMMLEPFDLAAMEALDPALTSHVLAEAMKRAFADRAFWLGDPEFADVPRGLCEDGYCADMGRAIDLDHAEDIDGPGLPPAAGYFGKHTTHVSTADAGGTWVALTTTINTSFGSKVVVPGTGVLLNNQMDDFSVRPGVPNAYGLVGAEANAIAPRKRPLSSMSPTIVLANGQPVLSVGGAGGPTIITQVVQVLVNVIDHGMTLEDALAAPRIHHQWRPDVLEVEPEVADEIVEGLKRRGHEVEMREAIGVAQAVGQRGSIGVVAVREPRLAR